MELVVVNGASNISKSVIRGLAASGNYSSVRLLDFRPFRKSVYDMQRELSKSGVHMEKFQTTNANDLKIAMEGAQNVVYLTHDYVTMTSDKNNFLVATAKIAKMHGVKNMVALCPIEHDLAYSEEAGKDFIAMRQESEAEALTANPKMSLMTSDLVYGEDAQYIFHYMA